MTKQEYLSELKAELAKNAIADADDVVTEYEQHFLFKLADGFTEEEIAAKLGAPQHIAQQFAGLPSEHKRGKGRKALLSIWLSLIGLFEGVLYLTFFGFAVALFGAALVCVGFGVELIAGFNYFNLLPPMPYAGALVFGIVLLSLGLIFFLSALYCFAFLRQMIRASLRWRKNLLSDETLPPLPLNPQFSPKGKRALRGVFLWALLIFGTASVLGYTILALYTHSLGFWHALGWFGYPPTVY